MNSIDSQIPQMPEVRIARLEEELEALCEENARLTQMMQRIAEDVLPIRCVMTA